MSSKLKAKTFDEIKEFVLESFRNYNENQNAPQPFNEQYVTRKAMKWVPLKEYQKEQRRLAKHIRDLAILCNQKEKQIVEANKILNNIPQRSQLKEETIIHNIDQIYSSLDCLCEVLK
jgi:hypothetical protein